MVTHEHQPNTHSQRLPPLQQRKQLLNHIRQAGIVWLLTPSLTFDVCFSFIHLNSSESTNLVYFSAYFSKELSHFGCFFLSLILFDFQYFECIFIQLLPPRLMFCILLYFIYWNTIAGYLESISEFFYFVRLESIALVLSPLSLYSCASIDRIDSLNFECGTNTTAFNMTN